MKIRNLLLSSILLATWLAGSAAADDIVWLKSGDRVTGRIVKKDGDSLVVKPAFGGEVKIPLKDVRSFQSDRDLKITLADGRESTGVVEGGAEEDATIREPGRTAFALPDVSEIKALEDPNVEPDYWSGRFYASLSIEDGNTQRKNYHADGIVVGDWKDYRLTTEGAYNYGREDGDLTGQDAYGQVKFDYFLSERFYLLARSRIEHDKFQDLRYRWTTGPGAGYQWLKEDKHYLVETEAGANWTREQRDVTINNVERRKTDGYAAADVTARGFWAITDGLRASFESAWIFSLEESRNYTGRTWVALDIAIMDGLALTAKIIWKYENETPPDVEHNDWQYLLGITWTAF